MLNQELDILEVRLSELFDTVDVFVVIEASVTHQGKPKPLYYRDNAQRFARFAKKIRAIAVNDLPTGDDNWAREQYQRQVLRQDGRAVDATQGARPCGRAPAALVG